MNNTYICLFVMQTTATKINATFVVHANRDLLVQVSSQLHITVVVATTCLITHMRCHSLQCMLYTLVNGSFISS